MADEKALRAIGVGFGALTFAVAMVAAFLTINYSERSQESSAPRPGATIAPSSQARRGAFFKATQDGTAVMHRRRHRLTWVFVQKK